VIIRIKKISLLFVLALVILIPGCNKYRKGDMYYSKVSGDSLNYVVLNSGKGTAILEKVRNLEGEHKRKNNEVQVLVVNDSAQAADSKVLLMVYTEMPDFENDMLTKGYMGGFGSKLIVKYVVVTFEDFDKYFIQYPEKNEKQD
jgi:hypothetical protein